MTWTRSSLLLLTVMSGLLAGCVRYVETDVRLVDGDTHEPLARVPLRVTYEGYALVPPEEQSAVTNDDGLARMRIADGYPNLTVFASGYLDSNINRQFSALMPEVRKVIESGDSKEVVAGTLRLWRAPKASVVFIVPDGYRGYIRTRRATGPLESNPSRHREFRIAVDESGLITMPPIAILRAEECGLGAEPAVSFESRNGTPIAMGASQLQFDDSIPRAWPFLGLGPPVYLIADLTTASEERALRKAGANDEAAFGAWRTRVMNGALPARSR